MFCPVKLSLDAPNVEEMSCSGVMSPTDRMLSPVSSLLCQRRNLKLPQKAWLKVSSVRDYKPGRESVEQPIKNAQASASVLKRYCQFSPETATGMENNILGNSPSSTSTSSCSSSQLEDHTEQSPFMRPYADSPDSTHWARVWPETHSCLKSDVQAINYSALELDKENDHISLSPTWPGM